MKKIPKYLLETDVLLEYLVLYEFDKESYLIKLMQKGICFTSVLNASELFMFANSDYEKEKVRDLLNALKVLGLHSRYSLSIPNCMNNFKNIRDALFYILAEQNRLSIVSLNPEKYSGLSVKSVHPDTI
ncbi:MAG: PIN domain-containing protein [Ignavibacteriales bacterium]|nr:PIN domain-containing protein [Ignavibacteriales bacterium]MBP9119866.1 PIN domain-containing protein [Ignavibacterium sp.]